MPTLFLISPHIEEKKKKLSNSSSDSYQSTIKVKKGKNAKSSHILHPQIKIIG
jgi:hypothetical protein